MCARPSTPHQRVAKGHSKMTRRSEFADMLRGERAQHALRRPARTRGTRSVYTPARVRRLYLYCGQLSSRLTQAPGLSVRVRGELRLVLWRHMLWGAARSYSDPVTLRSLEGCAYALGMIATIYSVDTLNMSQRLALLGGSLRPPPPRQQESGGARPQSDGTARCIPHDPTGASLTVEHGQ